MAHRFKFEVEVTVERTTGKFASREELADAIRDMLENADEGSIYSVGADGDSEYETTEWQVEVVEP